MPLTASKIAHIKAKIDTLFAQRSQAIIFTRKLAGGGTTTVTIQGIFRPTSDQDISFNHPSSNASDIKNADALLVIQQRDMDYPTLRSVIFLEPQTQFGADFFASRYRITSIQSKGIPVGGDRWVLTLDRQR